MESFQDNRDACLSLGITGKMTGQCVDKVRILEQGSELRAEMAAYFRRSCHNLIDELRTPIHDGCNILQIVAGEEITLARDRRMLPVSSQ